MGKAERWRVLAFASLLLGIAQVVAAMAAISAGSWSWVLAVAGVVFWYWVGVGAWRRWSSAARMTSAL